MEEFKKFLELTKTSGQDFGLALWELVYSLWNIFRSIWFAICAVFGILNPFGATGRFAFILGGWFAIGGVGWVVLTLTLRLIGKFKGA